MNKHNIIDSFFNDMFRPSSVGKAKSPIVKSCRCLFLGSKSETVIRMYTDKMSCVFRFLLFGSPNIEKVRRHQALELSHRIWNQIGIQFVKVTIYFK